MPAFFERHFARRGLLMYNSGQFPTRGTKPRGALACEVFPRLFALNPAFRRTVRGFALSAISVLFLLDTVTGAVAESRNSHQISSIVPAAQPAGSNWCWLAVVGMVLSYLEYPVVGSDSNSDHPTASDYQCAILRLSLIHI